MTKTVHLLPLLAGIAVALLCCIGIAAYLGWTPAEPLANELPSPASLAAAAAPPCGRCGLIEAVREVGNARGVSHRVVAGAALAQQLGGFSSVTNVLGLVVVALAGRMEQQEAGPAQVYETLVRFEDGSARVLTEVNPPLRKPGDPVKVVSGRIYPMLESAIR